MNINEEFPSKYLKAADLHGRAFKLKIKDVMSEQIGNDRKLVIYFDGKQKGMVLNKTNARTIADVFGDETDAWLGADIEVFGMKVDFQGRMVDGLRVRTLPPPRTPATAPAAQGTISVMPNARDRAMAGTGAGNPPAPAEAYDDEIPF